MTLVEELIPAMGMDDQKLIFRSTMQITDSCRGKGCFQVSTENVAGSYLSMNCFWSAIGSWSEVNTGVERCGEKVETFRM